VTRYVEEGDMIKRLSLLALCLAFCLSSVPVAFAAFPSDEMKVLDKKAIAALTDEQLTDNYVDVIVEIEAVKTFHATSGFTPNEYNNYKGLLKYRLLLLIEIHKRKLELPPALDS
jgi:hypothetical protein